VTKKQSRLRASEGGGRQSREEKSSSQAAAEPVGFSFHFAV
jgi:hypothetical protein